MVFSRCVPALFYSPEAEIQPCLRDAWSHEPVYSSGGASLSAGVSALSAMGGLRDSLTVPFIKEKPMGRGVVGGKMQYASIKLLVLRSLLWQGREICVLGIISEQ